MLANDHKADICTTAGAGCYSPIWRVNQYRVSTALNRDCPNCSENTISVSGLIVSNFGCPNCRAIVGVRWLYKAGFFLVMFVVTVLTSIAVLAQQGVYAALLWLPFPIAAIGYLKARFCPLETKQKGIESRGASDPSLRQQ
jgi:uncharacterized protein (DUF983 family)